MPVRRRRSSYRPWLDALLGTTLALAACNKPKDDAVVAPDGGGGATSTGPGAPVELAPVDHPSQLLPRGTAVLVTGTSFSRAAEVFERDRLVEAFGPQYTSIRAAIVGSIGHDLLDPKAWPEVGLDPGGTVGVAVSGVGSDAKIVLLATVSDRKKLVDAIRSIAGKAATEMVEEAYGSASILRPKGEPRDGVVVLRDRFAALVIDTGKGNLDYAKLMVTMDPNVSLASQAAYRKATGGLRAADLVTYLDVAGMVDQANARSGSSVASNDWAKDELARAQKEGATPERIAELQLQVEQARKDELSWRKRDEGQRALSELVVSGIEGIGLTATAKRSGPVLDGRVVAGEDAFVRRLLVNRPGASTLPVAMNGAPLWCGAGRIDPAAGFELFEAMGAANGRTPVELGADGKRELGIDIAADLVPVLGGDAELCFTFEGTPGEGRMDPKTQLGLGAIVQMTDAAKAKYVLAKIATSGSELAKHMKKRGEGYTVDVPEWRTVHVQTAGDRVVVTTDPELAKRLASGDPGSMPSKIRPPGAMGAIGLQGTAASQVVDLSLSVLWTMVGRSSMGAPVVVAAGLTLEEMEKVPLSAKTKKAKKAMEKAHAKVRVLEAKREAAEVKQVLAFTDGLGVLVTAATEDDRGFTLTGGQFLRAESLGRVLESLLRAATGGVGGATLEPADQKALDDAWQRWSDAQRAYTDARMEDGERAAKKLGKGPEPVPEIAPAG